MSNANKINESIEKLIGNTPLVELHNYGKIFAPECRLLAKVEFFNPGGSSKDRVAREMIMDAEASGRLKPGSVIIEPTSGNTGVGLAMLAAAKGCKSIFTMPETMSIERIKLLKAYGAEIVLTPGAEGMQGAVAKAEQLKKEIPGAVIMGQFTNPANPKAHYKTTGPELWRDTDGKVDIFVAGVGTGGTITGTGLYLKEKNPNIKVVAVEPAASPLLSEGKSGPHKIQGIGANFVPEILDRTVYDRVISVTEAAAAEAMRQIATIEGLFVGISSGAALWAAAELGRNPENRGKLIVVLLPDTGERYLSLLSD